MKKHRALWAVICLVALLSAAYTALRVFLLTPALAEKIRSQIIQSAQNSLNEPLQIEKLSFDFIGMARIKNIKIGTKPQGIFNAPKATVHLNYANLIAHPRAPILVVKNITLSNPEINLIRDEKGKWNFHNLLKPPKPGVKVHRPTFPLRINRGHITFTDQYKHTKTSPEKISLKDVNGKIFINGERGNYSLKLQTSSSFASNLLVEGNFSDSSRWKLKIKAAELSLAEIQKSLSIDGLRVSGFARNLELNLSPAHRGGINGLPAIDGTVELKTVSVASKKLLRPLHEIDGKIKIARKVFRLDDICGEANGGNFCVSGAVFADKNGKIALHGNLSNISLTSLQTDNRKNNRSESIRGTIGGEFFAEGDLSNPTVLFEFQGKQLGIRKNAFDSGNGTIIYRDNTFDIRRTVFRRGDGWGKIEGTISFAEDNQWSASLAAKLEGIETHNLIQELGAESQGAIGGVFSGTVLISKEYTEPYLIMGTISGERIIVPSFPESLSSLISFQSKGNELRIQNLVLKGKEEYLAAHGEISSDGTLAINIDRCGGNAGQFLGMIDRQLLPAAGKIEITGKVGGTLKEPHGEFDINGRGLGYRTIERGSLRGKVRLEGKKVTAERMRLITTAGSAEASGAIATDGSTGELEVSAKGILLQNIAAILEDTMTTPIALQGLHGEAEGDFRIHLTSGVWETSGAVNGRNLEIQNEKIDSFSAEFFYDRALNITNGSAQMGRSRVAFSGMISTEELAVEFNSKAFDLSAIKLADRYSFGGDARLSGTITGTMRSPLLIVEITSADLNFRKIALSVGRGHIEYKDGVFLLEETNFLRGNEKYTIWGGYDLATRSADMHLLFEEATTDTLQKIINTTLPGGTEGKISGELRLIGVQDELAGTIQMRSKQLTFGNYPLTLLEMEGRFRGSLVTIEHFYAHNDVSQIQASGMIDLERTTESMFNLEATGIELETISQMGYLPIPMKGLADVYVNITGEKGEMLGSVEAYSPVVADLHFDRMRGLFHYVDYILTLNNFQFLTGDTSLAVSSIIPFREKEKGNFQMLIKGEKLPLALINDRIAYSGIQLEGTATLHDVMVKGDYKQPAYYGTVEFVDGGLQYGEMRRPISEIKGFLRLDGKVGVLDALSCNFGGKTVEMGGGLAFKGFLPDQVDISFSSVINADFEYGELLRGKIDVEGLRLIGAPGKWKLTGAETSPQVNLHDGVIDLAALPTMLEKSAGAAAAPIEFAEEKEIHIRIGSNMMVRSGINLKLYPEGEVTLAGTMDNPQIKGALYSKRGYIRPGYSDLTFEVTDPVVIGFYSPEGIGVVPIFYANGKARVSGIDVYMESSGPMIDIARMPAYRELCQGFGVEEGGAMSDAGVPRILVGGEEEMTIPVCPTLRLYARKDNDPAGAPMPLQEIMARITHTEELRAGTPLTKIITSGAFGMFTPVLGTAVEQSINLENFQINLDPNKDILVELEKRIAPKFYVRLARLFSQEVQQKIDLRYRFRKNSYLLWSIDQDNEYTYQVEYRINF
ncbi:MAG: translocation/assembly module TamB domain-containing protein [bacterium]